MSHPGIEVFEGEGQWDRYECPGCDGTGSVTIPEYGYLKAFVESCRRCLGSGRVAYDKKSEEEMPCIVSSFVDIESILNHPTEDSHV